MSASQVQLIPTKLALRRTIKAQRQSLTGPERERVSRAIAAVALELPRLRQAVCVSVYASLPDEPSTDQLRDGLRELGIRMLLPVVCDDTATADQAPGRTLDWAEDVGDLTATGALGLPEPQGPRFGSAELGKAQVVIVPALAVDTFGTRLGRGRGFYDTALTQAHPEALILALVHDREVLDAGTTPIPREPHDVAVHGVITATRWMFFDRSLISPSRG
jgi:5-formyltetrahydrofolate cyclo-ligase